ncbi:hypothetical protein JK202_03825 [Gluconobacter sp. Dm-62]|uniref:hypothetical protein n=1 Tax=Gluconobacter sp. Dm-62 TaxID=2799804 RepID=UPI001B8D8B0F|nr:hypothetical protein [Gluconobacter sp. Dm-62]MBS1102147.1 hypothetical protein [Gluconobacter sp. Dm-62]
MIDFSSWHSLLATLIGLALFTLIGVGIRLLTMLTIQQRRERMNRQINERLRVLMAAYRTLGGSFTGDLVVDPAHKRDLSADQLSSSDRNRRIRDAVEAALSDIILLGTEEQVRLAGRAAAELVTGRPVPTHDLVVSLRNFIRKALNLESLPADLVLPEQGPTRPSSNGGSKGEGKEGGKGGGGAGGGGGGMGMQGSTEPGLHHADTESHIP